MKTALRILLTALVLMDPAGAVTVVTEDRAPWLKKEIRQVVDRAAASDSDLADQVRSHLNSHGYLDAAAELRSDTLRVSVGDLSYLNEVSFVGDSVWQAQVSVPFTSANLDAVVTEALRSYQMAGYLYAAASVTSFERNGSKVAVTCRFVRGPLVRLGALRLTGLVRSRPEGVRRYFSAAAGDTLTSDLIARIEREARGITYLAALGPPALRPREGYTQADLELAFAEKRSISVEGGGGYVSGDEGGLVWSVDMVFANLFGGGREASVRSERRDEDRQMLDVGYRQPVFLFGPGTASAAVSTRDYREDFYEFGITGDYIARVTPDFSVGVALGWKSVEPAGEELSYSRSNVGFTALRSTLDGAANPSSGYALDWSLDYVRRAYGDRDDSSTVGPGAHHETRAALSIDAYQRLVGRAVAHVRLGYRGLETDEVLPPLSELILIGGPGSIRGYRNEQYAAIRAATATFEPRLCFDQGALFAFYDGAYVNNRIAIGDGFETDEFYRSGYGLGLAIVERHRSITVSLAWNPDLPLNAPRLSLEFSSDL